MLGWKTQLLSVHLTSSWAGAMTAQRAAFSRCMSSFFGLSWGNKMTEENGANRQLSGSFCLWSTRPLIYFWWVVVVEVGIDGLALRWVSSSHCKPVLMIFLSFFVLLFFLSVFLSFCLSFSALLCTTLVCSVLSNFSLPCTPLCFS